MSDRANASGDARAHDAHDAHDRYGRHSPCGSRSRTVELDRDTVERDLMKLVLAVVELLRQLMERQALRRVEQEDLTEDQEERIGLTLMLLTERMDELCERYAIEKRDLNLDLGPLGPLLPPE